MNLKPFNLEKALAGDPVVTRDGKKVTEIVRLKTVDNIHCNIIGVVDGIPRHYEMDGVCNEGFVIPHLQLFMAPKIVKKSGWLNIYPNDKVGYYMHQTKMTADCNAEENRLACVKVEWEEEEQS